MKSQLKRFSKSTLSVVLAFCMLVSCATVGLIATDAAVDNSEKAGAVEDSEKVAAVDDSETVGYDAVDIHTNASVDGGWVTTNLSTSDGNHYTGNIYFKGKTSGNYEMGMHVAGVWKVFGGYWINDNTAYNTAWGSGGSANDQIPPISTDTTKYIKGVVDFYKEYSGKPQLLIDQQLLTALSTTATVGTTSLQSGSTTTVGCTNSGGSGSYSNSYTVRQGSASGTDVTSSVLSGTTFTAPSVSSSTTYYVTTTVTDSNTGATATSAAKTITVSPANTCTLSLDKTTKQTLNIGETFELTVTSQHCSGSASNLSITSSSSTYVSASLKGTGTNSRTYTIKALKPTSSDVTLTASCSADSNENQPTLKVAVRTPQFTLSYSPSTIPATGSSTASPTVSINTSYANSGSTKSNLSYSITNGSSYATINSSNGTVTSTTTAGSVTAKVSGTITYNGVSYTTAEGTATVTVSALPSVYMDVATVSSNWSSDQNKGGTMTYDSTATTTVGGTSMMFKLTVNNLSANTTYYLGTWDGTNNYKPSSSITSEQPLTGSGVSATQSSGTTSMTTGAAGTYYFYYDYVNHKYYVEYPALVYSYTVNAKYAKDSTGTDFSNVLTGATVTPSSGSWTTGDSATTLSATTVSGYTFAQWAVTTGTGTLTNPSSRTGATFIPTSDNAVVTAQYKKNYSVSYNATPNNGTVSVNPTTGLVAGDTFTATFSPSSGYFLDTVTISNDQNVSVSNNSYTGTASGDNAIISVTATFSTATWTVAGDSTDLFGTQWDAANSGNNMTTSDNTTFTKVYSNVALTAGDIEFKVVQNHSWDNLSYPSSNKKFNIPQNGNYNVTITYNDNTHAVTATAELIKEYYLLGFGSGADYWGTSSSREVAARKMTLDSSTGKYRFTYGLAQQTYAYGGNDGFKVYCNDGTWYGHNGGGDNMSRSNSGPWTMGTGDGKGNIGVVADVAGDYIFEFDPSNSNIKIYYPNTVTFDTHDGSSVNSQVVTYGGTATRPSPDPTKTGYTFTNWYTAETGGSVFNFSTSITQDTTVHARWSPISYSITYPSSPTGYTLGSSNPTGAQYGDSVSFTVTASSGYRITGVTYTPTGGSAQNCTAGSNNTYSFTMPAANVTISVSTVKTYTVKLTATSSGGFNSRQYKLGSSGTYASYSSGTTLTVDAGTEVYFKVTYKTGYRYKTKTSNLTIVTANTEFKTAAVSANVTATLTAEKIPYALTGSVSPAHGTVTFYSDSTCETQITTATYQQTVYAKYTPADGYVLKNFTYSGTGITNTSTSGNVFTFTMGYAAATITANVMLQYSVTYYVDMHNNTVNSLSVAICSQGWSTVLKDSDNNDCSHALQRQGSSSVYAYSINTPVTQTNGTYSDLYIRVTFNGTNYNTINIPGTKVATLVSTHEMWLEAENEESTQLTVNYSTRSTSTVPEGSRRIYVAKPYSWETSETNWATLGIYHWGNYTDIGWSNGIRMNYLGNSGSDGYHYYYADIPKAINGNKVSNIIFQGWNSTNPAAGTSPNAQTGNIENIPDSANFYILSKDGNAFVGTKSEEDAVIANYTRYVSSVTMNKTESTEVNIKPTYTGEDITYTSGNTSVVTVDSNGKITPQGRGTTNITVKIYGTIGSLLTTEDNDHKDYITYPVSVTVKDPTQFNGFEPMSFESKTYTVNIPAVSGNQPGYFDMSNVVMTVEGIHGVTSSTSSAIITQTSTASVTGVGTVCTAFTVQYAKANSDFTGYNNIRITGKTVTKSIKIQGDERYGHDHWEVDDVQDDTIITTRKIYSGTDTSQVGIETATTNGIPFNSAKATYSDIFAAYSYVDVTFTFNYYEYKPKKVDADGNVVADNVEGMIQYPYDSTWAGGEVTSNANFAASHTQKTFTVSNYEVRGKTADNITTSDLATAAATAIGVMPSNNYYTYSIAAANTTKTKTGTYTANSTVNMTQNVRNYSVYLNGSLVRNNYKYQEYAEPSVNNASDWYAVDDKNSTDTTNAPLLATNVNSYKFRVKGSAKSTNTYLRTAASTNPHGNDFLRSEVDFSHYEVTHQGSSPTSMKEYLMQNFYIADFFSPAEVLDPNSYSGKGKFGPAYKVETVNESTSTSSGNITVYFTDSLDWNDIHVYYWGENINNVNWPGSVMTQSGTDGDGKKIYSAEIPGTAEGVIFTGNNNQTVDITNNIANDSHWKSKNEIVRNGIPYDNAQFVGGGVVYYSMNGATENNQGTPFANAVSSGYVGNDGIINANAIKEMLKTNIEAYYSNDVSAALGEEEAMKVAYGTEIAATKNVEGGFNTGIIYRYLPLTQYKRNGNGEQTVDITLPAVDSKIVKYTPGNTKDNENKWPASNTNDGDDPAASGKRTVRFVNNKNWDVVCVHYWGGSTASHWPGIKMSKVGNTNVYEAVIPADSTNVVFSDGGYMPETDGNGDYTLDNKTNNNTFRYSNSLQSYQYVYASGNENKATNAGKNMRLYSYYVYSYVTYDQETNVPVTKYEIVLSDNYSDASTYWEGNPNPDPSN